MRVNHQVLLRFGVKLKLFIGLGQIYLGEYLSLGQYCKQIIHFWQGVTVQLGYWVHSHAEITTSPHAPTVALSTATIGVAQSV